MFGFRYIIVNTLYKGDNRDNNNNNNNNNNIVLLLGVDSNRRETQVFRHMMLCPVLNTLYKVYNNNNNNTLGLQGRGMYLVAQDSFEGRTTKIQDPQNTSSQSLHYTL